MKKLILNLTHLQGVARQAVMTYVQTSLFSYGLTWFDGTNQPAFLSQGCLTVFPERTGLNIVMWSTTPPPLEATDILFHGATQVEGFLDAAKQTANNKRTTIQNIDGIRATIKMDKIELDATELLGEVERKAVAIQKKIFG